MYTHFSHYPSWLTIIIFFLYLCGDQQLEFIFILYKMSSVTF